VIDVAGPVPGTQEWFDQVEEEILEPDRRIIDPHHHLVERPGLTYLLPELWADTGTGHKIEKTVYIQCQSKYLEDGPEHLKCLGETAFVAGQAQQSAGHQGKAEIAAIIPFADLCLGDEVIEVLEAHEELANGRFRGIRHPLAHAVHAEALWMPGRFEKDLYLRDDFRRGLRLLGKLGLTYDSWHYHYQNLEFAELARAAPDTIMILDHFGTPIGVGPYSEQREEIFEQWKKDIVEVAKCDNVVAKLGGLAMPDNGYGWDKRNLPATSDELVDAQNRYYMHAIECFGPDRCMFESNFPVDRRSISYAVLYNAFKKFAEEFSEDEKDAMFRGTAARIYRI
jgi:predicted TIM-barrel fold metal-dependent hydrolase